MAPRKGPPRRQRRLRGGPPKKKTRRKRAVSAYNRFIGARTRGGKMTMKQAAAQWRKRGKRTSATRAKPRSRIRGRTKPKSTGGRKMAGFNSQKVMKFVRLIALGAPALQGVAQHGMTMEAAKVAVKGWTGVDMDTGQFDGGALAAGWTPYLAAVVTTYGVPKLAGIIRSF